MLFDGMFHLGLPPPHQNLTSVKKDPRLKVHRWLNSALVLCVFLACCSQLGLCDGTMERSRNRLHVLFASAQVIALQETFLDTQVPFSLPSRTVYWIALREVVLFIAVDNSIPAVMLGNPVEHANNELLGMKFFIVKHV